MGGDEFQAPASQPLKADGKLHRVTADGRLALVPSGFINPWNTRSVGDELWVTAISGEFIDGKRELPDGLIEVASALGM